MFDIGWQELFLVAIIALLVVGPKELPRALKTVTGAIRKVRGMARDFQSGLDDIVRESDLAEMRRELEAETGGDLRKSIENSIDPDGDVAKDLDDMRDIEGDLTKAAKGFSDEVKTPSEATKTAVEEAEVVTQDTAAEPAAKKD